MLEVALHFSQSMSQDAVKKQPVAFPMEAGLQVWWAVSTPVAQFLEVYNLASGRTTKVPMRNELSPVTVLRLGEGGLLWVGHQKGELKVWSEASQLPLTPPLQLFDCDVRWATWPT